MKRMKLWQQIFLCSLAMIMLAIDIIACLLLYRSHQLLVEQEQSRGVSDHQSFSVNLVNNVLYERLKQNRFFLAEETVLELIKKQTDTQGEPGSGVLVAKDKRWLASRNPEAIEASGLVEETVEEDVYQVKIVDVGSHSYLVVHSLISIEGQNYDIFTSSDVSKIYLFRDQQLQSIQIMSVICGCMIAGILLVLLLWLLAPLKKINDTTRQIAKGHYNIRVDEQGSSELVELCRNMNRMADAIEKNVNALQKVADDRRDFIANLAHEMKTPLTSILGFGDLLRIQRMVPDEQRQEYAGIIVEEAKRLRTLSGKLMELITVGNTTLEKEWIALPQLFGEVQAVLTPMMEKSGISLQAHPIAGMIWIDQELFKSLLYNLIDNAVKASAIGNVVILEAKRLAENRVRFSIMDHGIGMKEEEIRQAVQPFYMADKSRTRKHGGAGLGLALCVEIVKLHGGELSMVSQPGEGTTVSWEMEGKDL